MIAQHSIATSQLNFISETLFRYIKVITTRSYDDRLRTIANVREAGLSVCSGGILGLGEVRRPPRQSVLPVVIRCCFLLA